MSNIAMGPGQDVFGPSQALWQPVDMERIQWDRDTGWMASDDFSNYSVPTAIASYFNYGMSEGNTYRSYEEGGGAGDMWIGDDDCDPATRALGTVVAIGDDGDDADCSRRWSEDERW